MKKARFLWAVLALLLLPAQAAAQAWEGHTVQCPENSLNCRILQMGMMGSFDAFDADDPLTVRTFSAVYPLLASVSEDDFAHFLREYPAAEDELSERYFSALSKCLWAEILSQGLPVGAMSASQRVVLLFLDPDGEENAEYQIREIQQRITDDAVTLMARELQAPPDLIRYLIQHPGI